MKVFKIIKDKDIGLSYKKPKKYKERKAARAVVFDKLGKVAFLSLSKKDYYKIPGGGFENNEDCIQALRREVLEEAGCNIKNIKKLGIIEEYRNKFLLHQISYCFIADLDGKKGMPNFTEKEKKNGFGLVWVKLDEAIKTMEKLETSKDYQGRFVQIRDLSFLKEAQKFYAKKLQIS